MNNKETLQSHNTRLDKNNTGLTSVLNKVNSLPNKRDTATEDGIIERTLTTIVNSTATKVGNGAFFNATTLKKAELYEVTSIGTQAFYGTPLNTLVAPKVKTTGNYAFQGTKLAEVILPSLESAGMDSFRRCDYLTKCYLPKLSSFITSAFGDCTNLEAFIIEREDKVCTMGSTNVFVNSGIANGTGYVYVHDTLLTQYQQATNWSTFATQIKGLSEMSDELKQWVEEAKTNGN